MNKRLRLFCISWMLVLLGACSKEVEVEIKDYNELKIDELSEDIIVPAKVWDLLEYKDPVITAHEKGGHGDGNVRSNAHGEAKGGGETKSAVQSKETTLADVNIYLADATPGVVKGSPVKIKMPRGGGTLDLANYITDVEGSFYFRIEYPAFEDSSGQKVVFQSKTKKRKLDDKIWGAGCNQILDITKLFIKNMSKNGLKVNSTRQRHMTVLGGTFFFSAKIESGFSVAQVTIKDSKHKNIFCGAN